MNIQNMEGYIIFRVFLTFIFCSPFQFSVCLENVARGKTASQNSDLIWNNFTWSADRAVDGCLTQADPDSSGCCSCNIGNGLNNYWKVNLGEKYFVINVTIIGRKLGAEQDDSQLLPFQLFAIETADGQEVEIYDSGTQDYGNGIFYITFQQAVEMTVLVVRRLDHNLLTLCEVQVFADTSTTTAVATQSTTPTEVATQSTTPTEAQTQSTAPTEAATQSITTTEDATHSTTQTEAPIQSTVPTEAATQSTTTTEDATHSTTQTEAPIQSTTSTERPTQSSNGSRATVISPQPTTLTTKATGTNVALNKTATQNSDLDFAGFLWTADKAVDGCTNQDNPDGERCCSASEGTGAGNYWKVDLGAQYNVELVTVYGRSPGGDIQLAGFSVYTQETVSGTESLLYTQTGDYAPGIFNITVNPVRTVRSVVIRRPAGDIITLCEVEVYDFTITTTTSTRTTTTQPGQGKSIGVSIYTTGAIWTPLLTLMSILALCN